MADSADSVTRYRLTGNRLSPQRIRVDTGDAEFVVGKKANPIEYFLGAAVGCLNSTATMVARDMDLDIESLEIAVEGGVDYSRYLGKPSESRPGLQSIQLTVDVEADADEDTIEAWLEAVEERCPVTDNVGNPTPLSVELERA